MTSLPGLCAVDPGVHFCAVACFWQGELRSVEHRTIPLHPGGREWRTVCEIPQVHDPRRAKQIKRPADLIDLAVCAGRMTGAVECEYVLPAQWKGQLPCSCSAKVQPTECVHHRRVLAALSTQELSVLNAATAVIPAGIRHNMYDAVGLGLVALGRLTPAGVRGRKIGQEA